MHPLHLPLGKHVGTPQAVIPGRAPSGSARHKGKLMAPAGIEFVDEIPLTNLGKVDKKAIRAPYWESRARQV